MSEAPDDFWALHHGDDSPGEVLSRAEREHALHDMFRRITELGTDKLNASLVNATVNLHGALCAIEQGGNWQAAAEDRFTELYGFTDVPSEPDED